MNKLSIDTSTDLIAESTRSRILQAAHEEMYEHGFQGLRIDAVLKKTHLAKGALYHYFPTKLALGYAVVDEVLMTFFQQNWHYFLTATNDPLLALQNFFKKKCDELQSGECCNGCPMNNLIQEMSTLDEGFHLRLQSLMNNIIAEIAETLAKGQEDGIVRKDIEPKKIATFLLSSYQGIMGVTKCMPSVDCVTSIFDTLGEYVESLRVVKS